MKRYLLGALIAAAVVCSFVSVVLVATIEMLEDQ